MKIKPFSLWAVVDNDGSVVALKTSRAQCREFAREWSNEIIPMHDRGPYGMVLAMYGDLHVRKVRVSA